MLKHLFGFSSRSNRTEFLFWLFIFGIISFIIGQGMNLSSAPMQLLWRNISLLFSILIGWLVLTLLIRRLHDCNYSAWWIVGWWLATSIIALAVSVVAIMGLISFVSFAYGFFALNLIVTLILLMLPGTKGENRFGTGDKHYYPGFMNSRAGVVAVFILFFSLQVINCMVSVVKLKQLDTQLSELRTQVHRPLQLQQGQFPQAVQSLATKAIIRKSFRGLCTRLLFKFLAFNLCLLINFCH